MKHHSRRWGGDQSLQAVSLVIDKATLASGFAHLPHKSFVISPEASSTCSVCPCAWVLPVSSPGGRLHPGRLCSLWSGRAGMYQQLINFPDFYQQDVSPCWHVKLTFPGWAEFWRNLTVMKTHKASASWFLAQKKRYFGPKLPKITWTEVPTVVLGVGISFDMRKIWNFWKGLFPQAVVGHRNRLPMEVATAQDRAQGAFVHSGTCTTLNRTWNGKILPDRAVIPQEFCYIFHGTTMMANSSKDVTLQVKCTVWCGGVCGDPWMIRKSCKVL